MDNKTEELTIVKTLAYGIALTESPPCRRKIMVDHIIYDIPLPWVTMLSGPGVSYWCWFSGKSPVENDDTVLNLPYLYNLFVSGESCGSRSGDPDPYVRVNHFWQTNFRGGLYYPNLDSYTPLPWSEYCERYVPTTPGGRGHQIVLRAMGINYTRISDLSVEDVLAWDWDHEGKTQQQIIDRFQSLVRVGGCHRFTTFKQLMET